MTGFESPPGCVACWGSNPFSCLAVNGRSAEERKVRPADPPVLPAPQKADANPENFPGVLPQVLWINYTWGRRPGPTRGRFKTVCGVSSRRGRILCLTICVMLEPRTLLVLGR